MESINNNNTQTTDISCNNLDLKIKKIYCSKCNTEIEKTKNGWKICRLCFNKKCAINNKKYQKTKIKIPKEKTPIKSIYKYNKNGVEVDVVYKLKNVNDNKKKCKGCKLELNLELFNIVKNNKGLD